MISKQSILHQLGYNKFRPLQEEAIDALYNGQDVLFVSSTGSGKSLVYQLTGVMKEGVAVIVSPLLSLMHQQVETLKAKGVRAEFLNSSLNPGEQDDLVTSLRHKHIDLLYLAPEKLIQPSVIGLLHSIEVSLFAIDEAHCITQWGSAFRPEYSQLGQLRDSFPSVPIIALTGTADKQTIEEVQSSLKLRECTLIKSAFDRPNIEIKIAQKRKAKQQLLHFLHYEVAGQSGVVYCRSRKNTESLSQWLSQLGFISHCYHAGMSEFEKHQSHQALLNKQGCILVATTAYGMGVDIAHLDFVVHMDLPNSPEAFLQEVGRAGRNGQKAKSLLLYGLQDMMKALQLTSSSNEDNDKNQQQLLDLFQVLEGRGCRRKNLMTHFGEDINNCGHCERCLTPKAEQNMTIAAQKILSLIYHTKGLQPFSLIIQVLVGKKTKAVTDIKAEKLSLFNKGRELTDIQWKSVIRYLLAYGFLRVSTGNVFMVHLTEKARLILKGEHQVLLPQEHFYPFMDDKSINTDTAIWHQLMRWRYTHPELQINEKQLKQVYLHKPNSSASMSRLTGLSKESINPYWDSLQKQFCEPESAQE